MDGYCICICRIYSSQCSASSQNGTIYITFAKPIIPSQHQNNRRRFATGLKSFRLQVAHLHLNDNIGSLKVLNR